MEEMREWNVRKGEEEHANRMNIKRQRGAERSSWARGCGR